MKKEYKFPIYPMTKQPDVSFQLVFDDGSKTYNYLPKDWFRAPKNYHQGTIVGWVPSMAEITVTPEEGKVYKVKLGDQIHYARYGETGFYLFEGIGQDRSPLIYPYPSTRIEILAEMKDVEAKVNSNLE